MATVRSKLVQLTNTPVLIAPLLSTARTTAGVELPSFTITSDTGDVPAGLKNVRLLIGAVTANAWPDVAFPPGVVTLILPPVAPAVTANVVCSVVGLVTFTVPIVMPVLPTIATLVWPACDGKRRTVTPR